MAVIWQERRIATLAERLAAINWLVPLLIAAIGGIGVLTLYSVGGGNMEPWAMRHVLRLMLGLALVLVLAAVPLRFIMTLALPVYLIALAGVAAVMSHGTEVMGAQRWLTLGPVSFQPSELMKVALVLMIARYYQSLPARLVSHPVAVAVPGVLILVPILIILKQPDLGTAALLGLIGALMMFLAGVSALYYAAAGIGIAIVSPMLWDLLHDYQKQRIIVFLDPEIDPLGRGYQIQQSMIALGSGGYTGKGLLKGTQGQLDFVPETHTDFIFTIFAEEMGFIGCMVLLALYVILLLVLVWMALRTSSVFGRLLIGGIGVSLFIHVFVNIAMVMGVAPVVGVPLPLVSYGGTSLFATMCGAGLALSAFAHRDDPISRKDTGWLF